MRKVLESNLVKIYLLGKYVNDVNLATAIIRKGCKWSEKSEGWRLVWSEDREEG